MMVHIFIGVKRVKKMTLQRDTKSILPPEQSYIQTCILQQICISASFLVDQPRHHTMIGIAVGEPGIGKSVALQYAQEQLALRDTPPKIISLRVLPGTTVPTLVRGIGHEIDDSAYTREWNIIESLTQRMSQHDVRLVILDEADRLNDACLDVVCSLVDAAHCSLLLVGLPTLFQRCLRQKQLVDRIGIYLNLRSLTFSDVLYSVLPAFVFLGWIFDPDQDEDRVLAEQLWTCAAPSLRQLHFLVSMASHIAQITGNAVVTRACIQEAIQHHCTHQRHDQKVLSEESMMYERKTKNMSLKKRSYHIEKIVDPDL